MSYTLDAFAGDMKQVLSQGQSPEQLEQTRQLVEKALKDPEFVETYLGDDAEGERKIIYEDPDLGFCILAHVYKGAKTGNPHDHGPAWAIYGQAYGETQMTEYDIVEPPQGDTPGKVAPRETYKMVPGDARVYQVGDIHCPHRDSETRLIRIEGMNMNGVKRTPLVLA
jgi:predicted metal-dependent enzyme (double-stranded beta helix superfamily)